MSWLRIEGRMPQHRKVAPLSDAAWRLHITAKCWCVEEKSDGRVPKAIPATLPAAPRGKALTRILDELVDAELWERTEDGFLIHDFLKYNPSAAESEARSQAAAIAGAAGGRAKAEKRHSGKVAHGLAERQPTPSEPLADCLADPKQPSTNARRIRSDSDSESEVAIATAPEAWPDGPVPCPVPLPLDDDAFAGLAELAIPRPVAEAFLRRWALDERAAKSNPRPVGAWVKCGLKALRGQWSDGSKRAEIRAMASPVTEPTKSAGEELRWV